MSNVHFQSGDTMYETPQEFYEDLNDVFQFTLDAAATEESTKCDRWLGPGSDIAEDAFDADWEGTVWLNPPYGRGIYRWVDKAYKSSVENGATVVCLLPARPDTAWFETCWKAPFLIFIRGRLRFHGADAPAPFPSCLAIFGNNLPSDLDISMLAGLGTITRAMWSYSPVERYRYEWLVARREEREANGDSS